MIKKFEKYIILIILIIGIPLLTSCGASGGGAGSIDGIPFNIYNTLENNNQSYNIYVPAYISFFSVDNKNNAWTYYYQEYQKKETEAWTINCIDNSQYLIYGDSLDNELLNLIYENMKDYVIELEHYLNIDLEIYKDENITEIELNIDSTKEYKSILIIDMYIPIVIECSYLNERTTVYIPVKKIIGYNNLDTLTLMYEEKMEYEYSYSEFINSLNVFKK